MRAQGVPWGTELGNHPLHVIFDTKGKNNRDKQVIVSDLYKLLTKASYKPLSLNRLWKADTNASVDLDWHTMIIQSPFKASHFTRQPYWPRGWAAI